MAVTQEDIDGFHRYAAERVRKEGSHLSLDDLLMEWLDSRERDAINAAIRRGLDDVDAGRHEPAQEALNEIRREFGFPEE